jgi:late competence protein required for DNA uptake (superfamily II DNA/RNA helicase)
MPPDQQTILDEVIMELSNGSQIKKQFFVNAVAGAGKTFLSNPILEIC